MEIQDKVVVVTGGASGIGASLAERFSRAGARGVVIADLDERATQEAADAIGATAVQADVTSDEDVARLIATAESEHGPIDLFCANAGIGRGTGLDSPDETWDAVLNVNVRAHIVAARQMIPRWL